MNTEETIDQQVRRGWKDYYQAISDGNRSKAKDIFDRTVALAEAPLRRRTTQRLLARAGL